MHCNVAEKWMVAPGWSNCWHERCDKCVSFYHANDFTCISFAIHNIPIYGPSTCRPTRANQHAERPTYPAIHQERENVSAATRYHCVGTQGRINHRQSHQLLFSPSFSPKKTFSSGKSKKVLALDNSCQLWKEDDQSSLLIGKVDWAIIISALQKMVSVTRKYATSRKYASYCCPEKMPPVCIGSRNFPGYLSRTLLCKMSLKSVQKDALVNFQMFQQIATGLLPFLSCLP